MKSNDKYELYINKSGVIFYYKNKKLHREAGPAIVIARDAEKYANLEDKDLYKKSISPIVNHDGAITKYIDNMYGNPGKSSKSGNIFGDYLDSQNNFWNQNDFVLQKHELNWNKSEFYLEDKEYSEEEFKKIQAKKFKEQLQFELSTENTEKKSRLKL
jgi:hypothetical protein